MKPSGIDGAQAIERLRNGGQFDLAAKVELALSFAYAEGRSLWSHAREAKYLGHNPPMTKSLAERQADFRQAMKDAGYVRLEAWVTKEQREKFRQLGGDEWLRKKIDAAKQRPDER